MKMRIKEVIVVEGKDDERAVKTAVDAEIIRTSGWGINDTITKRIIEAHQRCGIIIFTDPDHAGERIRKTVSEMVEGAKHAFLPREEAMAGDDIGIENASPESIIAALEKVRTEVSNQTNEFSQRDLTAHDLVGSEAASRRRDQLGHLLGIGYGNGKQFLKRLNGYGVTRQEFEEGLRHLEEDIQ